jgi:hypothetical protein
MTKKVRRALKAAFKKHDGTLTKEQLPDIFVKWAEHPITLASERNDAKVEFALNN